MTIALDDASLGTNSAVGSSTTITLTTTAAVASLGTIFLLLHWRALGTPVVTGGSLTWTVEAQADDSVGSTALIRADAPAGLASSTVITATFSPAVTERIISGSSFTGLTTAAKEDSDNAVIVDSAWASPSMTATSAENLVISAITLNTDIGNTPTAPNLETFDFGPTFDHRATMVYRINSSAGSSTNAGAYGAAGLILLATGVYGGEPPPVIISYDSLMPKQVIVQRPGLPTDRVTA